MVFTNHESDNDTNLNKLAIANLPDNIAVNDTLSLRILEDNDASSLLVLAQDVSVERYIPWAKKVHCLDDALEQLRTFDRQKAKGFSGRYGIFLKGTFIGYFGIWQDSLPDAAQTGSALLPTYRGMGVANMVRGAIQNYLQTQGITMMVAYVDNSNIASRRMIEKAGYQPIDITNDDGEMRYEKLLI